MAARVYLVSLLLPILAAVCLGCENPKVTPKVYSSTDATIVELVAFVGEFEVLCSDGDKNFPLFATLNDEVVPVTRTSDISKYIVSWAEEPSNAKSGSQVLRFFDEAGFGVFRKAQRAGEDVSKISPLFSVPLQLERAYKGPWVRSEFLAFAISVIIFYIAYSTKSHIMS
ncbi:unnamed protein product [Darwinula stevensoni]|uniref:Translocon-associated protein subunit delta n=1 Tax=Darwinula stevensoni TaxID=69355 RepID=A0A7R9A6H7_9CRUS|nr:unnamed protein product [Darwinula stevensoni]CAG0894624.1 unnamed protein product [Darwinula stevensoni]